MKTLVNMNNISHLLLRNSLILFYLLSIAPSALADCVPPKKLNPIQKITSVSNITTELAKKVDTVKSGEKLIPSLIECAKELTKLSARIDKDMKNLMSGIDKNDKQAAQDIMKQVTDMMKSTLVMAKEIDLADKRVPVLKLEGRLAKVFKPATNKTQVTKNKPKPKPKIIVKMKKVAPIEDLQARNLDGNSDTVEAFYNAKTNLTWLVNANAAAGSTFDNGTSTTDGKMSWSNAKDWAVSLNFNGITGWRLPTRIKTSNVSCNGGGDNAYPCTGSEMGYFYSEVLGGKSGQNILYKHNDNYYNFENISQCAFWSETESGPVYAGQFDFRVGKQQYGAKQDNSSMACAWAVHLGDVGKGKKN